ncbi:MAG: outer membrane protein assembly factor BamA [Gemmatimonadaceae bacterium]|nr:outer membrane protein assembly factor BamA [Gemmatimonadaceae bacterium]
MKRLAPVLLALLGAGGAARVQGQEAAGRACLAPDSIVVEGSVRVPYAQIITESQLGKGQALSFPVIQRAIRGIFALGQFDDVEITCRPNDPGGKVLLSIQVKERPVLEDVDVEGSQRISRSTLRDKVDLLINRPVDPDLVATAVTRMDSVYQANGYYLARVRPETTVVSPGRVKVVFRVEEGRRLAISGVRLNGNGHVPTKDVVATMKTRPEGFWFFRKGEFDEEKYAADLGERIPDLFQQQGFVDFQVARDTMRVDRARGKGLLEITVDEGPQYKVGAFEMGGNRRFSAEELARYYPFTKDAPTVTQRVSSVLRRKAPASDVFDRKKWDDATQAVRTAYSNEGYIYASIRPVVDRVVVDSTAPPRVNLRWDIQEGNPAIVNRIEILGNDYTVENCIREQLLIIPGDVFNQERLIRSYQSLGNLGFFETPIPPPDTRPANDNGDVDVIFRVKEKRTGNVNFGASVGQGTGLGGFIGLDQPNLFGQCKRAQLQWQFGRFINDFNLSFTDPNIKRSRVSGTVNVYRSQARFTIADLGQNIRIGGALRVGLPLPNSRFTRVFVSYTGERVRFGNGGLLGTVQRQCDRCFRSNMGVDLTHDTRIDMPFATDGGLQTISAQFNGGPLGGTATFQRYTSELRSYNVIGRIGGKKPGSQPIKLTFGLTGRSGFVFGDPGPFFFSQQFALGGVQFGEMLRGYPEFSITPTGFNGGTGTFNAQRQSFGSAFFASTAELGLRFTQSFYLSAFYDAGNLWSRARDFNPTRLFRGSGFGVSTVTPLGPLGLDWAYGFDRTDAFGRPAPKWQLHFRLGQLF